MYGDSLNSHTKDEILKIIDLLNMCADNENAKKYIANAIENLASRDLLMNSPSKVFDKQLEEVHIKLDNV